VAQFSLFQQSKIAYLLGYAQPSSGSTNGQNGRLLYDQLVRTDLAQEFIDQVQLLLAQVDSIESQNARLAVQAGIVKADIVEVNATAGYKLLRSMATQTVAQLAALLGFPVGDSSPYGGSGGSGGGGGGCLHARAY
jgi:hypothetical protein